MTTLAYRALCATGVPALIRRLRRGATVLCFHNVIAPASDGSVTGESLHMPADEFAHLIDWLLRYYDIVPLAAIAAPGGPSRQRRPMVALTFDDAYRGVLRHALPLLRQRGIPATIFVVSDSSLRQTGFWWDDAGLAARMTEDLRRRCLTEYRGDAGKILSALHLTPTAPADADRFPATWEELAGAIAPDLEWGAHSVSHRVLPLLSDGELARELGECRAAITARLGAEPRFFAYPYGLWDARVSEASRVAGYAGAFTLDAGLNAPDTNRWQLRRTNIPSGISLPAFEAWTAGLLPRRSLL